ncbi:MAG: flagellar basal body P-ring formation chaperone FlgA [Candidatus Sedimenticola endophacoides]
MLTATRIILFQTKKTTLILHYLRRGTLGNTLKRSLRMGSVLLPTHIKAPYAIKRGERVSIIAKSGELYVRMQGKALESGALNDRIQVRNESSDRKIEALVTARGVVEVTL